MRRFSSVCTVLVLMCLAGVQSAAAAPSSPPTGPIRLGFCGGDDWEPAFAVQGAYVYDVITHYVGNTSCDPASGNPQAMYIQVSTDGGRSFGAAHAVWNAPVNGTTYPEQADPAVAADASGNAVVSVVGLG